MLRDHRGELKGAASPAYVLKTGEEEKVRNGCLGGPAAEVSSGREPCVKQQW